MCELNRAVKLACNNSFGSELCAIFKEVRFSYLISYDILIRDVQRV